MKTLEIEQIENIDAGSFLSGACGGLLGAEGLVGLGAVAVEVGWMAAVPGLNVALLAVGTAGALTCGAATIWG